MTLRLPALALMLGALPALANPVTSLPAPQILPRDSDGIVISIIDVIDHFPGGVLPGGVVPGGVYYTFGGPEMAASGGGAEVTAVGLSPQPSAQIAIGGADLAAAQASDLALVIGGVSYKVESSGNRIWLRDLATGRRLVALEHVVPLAPDAQGLAVNPTAFALD